MKDILEYRDYRQYIADYYADRKAKSAFSWQNGGVFVAGLFEIRE